MLVFRDSVLRKMLNGQQPGVGDFEIEGDMALGFRLLTVIGGLRYRADRDLSRLFGEEAAERIGGRGRKIAGTLKSIGRSLLEQGADFSREPESPVVSREEFEQWAEEVEHLRDDIARLHARLDKFERDW